MTDKPRRVTEHSTDPLHAELAAAQAVILLDDRGESAERLAAVRRRLRGAGVRIRSLRTRQLRRALLGSRFAPLADDCSGQLLLLTTAGEPAELARLARDAQSERLHVRACALPGERLGLADMLGLPSRADLRARLLELLRDSQAALLDLMRDRCIEQLIVDPGEHRLFMPLAELDALRRRLERRLAVPGRRSDSDYGGRWTEHPLDVDALFAEVPDLRLRPGWRLRAYAYRVGGNGNGVIWALPPEAGDPPQLGTVYGDLRHPPRPLGGQPFERALDGDRSLRSYLHASLLLREISEYGALWHGSGWSDYQLVDSLPPDDQWEFERRVPRRLIPRVAREGADVIVTFWTYCHIETIRLTMHIDRYIGGGYRPKCSWRVLATAGFGAVH